MTAQGHSRPPRTGGGFGRVRVPPKAAVKSRQWHLPRRASLKPCAANSAMRFFNMIKQCRRVAMRYDKLAANYLAFIQLASIRLWLRVNEPAIYSAKFATVLASHV
jgi:hypothetical protein